MKVLTVVVVLLLICTFAASEEHEEKKIEEEKSRNHLNVLFRIFHNLNQQENQVNRLFRNWDQQENQVNRLFRNWDQQENLVNGVFRNWDHGKGLKAFHITEMAQNDSSNSNHNLGQQNLLSSVPQHPTVWKLLFPTSNIARIQDSTEMSMDEQLREMNKVLETTEMSEKMRSLIDIIERKVITQILRLHMLVLFGTVILFFCVREISRILANYYNKTLPVKQPFRPNKSQLSNAPKLAAADCLKAIVTTHGQPKISPPVLKTTVV